MGRRCWEKPLSLILLRIREFSKTDRRGRGTVGVLIFTHGVFAPAGASFMGLT